MNNYEYIQFVMETGYGTTYNHDISIIEGTSGTYEPYIPSVKMLAEEVDNVNDSLNDVEFLGWSVPKECPIQNYVDSDGVFHQRVGRVDLGSLTWEYDANVFFLQKYHKKIFTVTFTNL